MLHIYTQPTQLLSLNKYDFYSLFLKAQVSTGWKLVFMHRQPLEYATAVVQIQHIFLHLLYL